MDISRRKFLVLMSVIGGAAYCSLDWYRLHGVDQPTEVFVNLHNSSDAPSDVVEDFISANTPTLNASYSKFYPNLLNKWSIEAVDVLRNSCKIVKENPRHTFNHHRLDALPAITAAHLLPRTIGGEKDILFKEIADSLKDPRREVREMVLQNLLTSCTPDFDTLKYFSINDSILKSLDIIIEDAQDTPKLLTPLCLSVEFLLNARAILNGRGDSKQVVKEIDNRLKRIKESKVPHFNYLRVIIFIHNNRFPKIESNNIYSIPPQQTEALLGWEKLPETFNPYLRHLSLIFARQVYNSWATMTGVDNSALTVLSIDDAKQAFPKGIGFIKYYSIMKLLNSNNHHEIIASIDNDPKFINFLSKDLPDLLRNPQKYSIDIEKFAPSKEELFLSRCVPFCQFDNNKMATILSQDPNKANRSGFFELLDLGIKWAGSSFSLYKILCNAFKFTPSNETPKASELKNIKDKAITCGEEADKKLGDIIEKQEEKLGPIGIPGNNDSK